MCYAIGNPRILKNEEQTKTVLIEYQYLQSYNSLPAFLRPKREEDSHNFADLRLNRLRVHARLPRQLVPDEYRHRGPRPP